MALENLQSVAGVKRLRNISPSQKCVKQKPIDTESQVQLGRFGSWEKYRGDSVLRREDSQEIILVGSENVQARSISLWRQLAATISEWIVF